MKIEDILRQEQRTSIEDLYNIYIIKEGMWWRLYEWSVYLYKLLVEKGQTSGLQFIHKPRVLCCGCPEKSYNKYLNKFHFRKLTDEVYVATIKDIVNLGEISLENYNEILNEFRDSIPLSETKSKKNKTEPKLNKHNSSFDVCVNDIIKMLAEYSLMYKTPIDNYVFIANLQQKIMCLKDI